MDPLFDRLGRLFRSNNPFGGASGTPLDEDERLAMEELEAELNAPKGAPKRPAQEPKRPGPREPQGPRLDPALVQAYATLGVRPGATWEDINAAHRALLKKHHPDRHAGNEALLKQATSQSQKINEAFQVLKKQLGR